MNVITVLQPLNETVQRGFPVKPAQFKIGRIEAFEGGFPLTVSFPVPYIAVIAFACLLALTPMLQYRIGYYTLEPLTLAAESSAEASLRLFVYPDDSGDRIKMEEQGASDSIVDPVDFRTVTYSSYTVRNGDSVSGIASRFGLRNISTILSVNKIDNARRIKIGQSLKIPSFDGILHSVVRGESLSRIAGKYKVEVTVILDANDLESDTLVPGQSLFIPGGMLSTMELRKAMGELFIMPIKGVLTSSYGYRKDPFTGVRAFHTGIDLAASTGTPVKVTLDGRVATIGYSPVYGNYVIVTHDGGYQSLYAHLNTSSVKRGAWVTQGAIIGKVGNTGYSTGSHLHFSVYKNGKMIDPYSVLH